MDSGDAPGKPNVIRYDYVESRVKINGQRYIVKIDVEARNDKTNTARTYSVKNIDLVSLDGPITGPVPAGFRQDEQGLNSSMPHDAEKVNTPSELTNQPQPLPMAEDTARPLPSPETQQPQQTQQPQPLRRNAEEIQRAQQESMQEEPQPMTEETAQQEARSERAPQRPQEKACFDNVRPGNDRGRKDAVVHSGERRYRDGL